MKIAILKKDIKVNKALYIMLIPIVAYFVIFNYVPMAGIVMAFERFSPTKGVLFSPWIGMKNFTDFFSSYYFFRLIRNTFLLSFYDMIFGFPAPIIFALLLNEIKNKAFKKTIQTISYMPYFISLVVIAGIIVDFTSSTGAITNLVVALGGQRRNLLDDPSLFRTIFVSSNVWQSFGYGSIIYLSALSSIDQQLYEAAEIDGANRWKQTWHITLPGIAPTIIILLILRVGSLLNVGFEKVILLYNPATYETADVISSFVYRKGLLEFNYGYSTAVGLFNSVISLVLIFATNKICKKFSETSLF